MREARTYRDALNILCSMRVPVILCECSLPDGNWRDLLGHIAPIADRPRLIVTSLHAEHDLWLDVLAMGGCDVIPKPFQESEVRRVVELAHREWESARARLPHAAFVAP